tara:strand:+ start:52 stop:306 length:255 start_codon:yes stop_codon:yes gene_type:complete
MSEEKNKKQDSTQTMISNLKTYYVGMMAKHKANVSVYLNNPAGIGEHNDIIEAIDKELDSLASAWDKHEILNKFFDEKNKSVYL